jgi:glycogen operon protein
MTRRVWPGKAYPLGATWDGNGTNFALYSENAEKVELCFFDAGDYKEADRICLREHTDMVWHAYLPDVPPGQLYGYRVHGKYDPAKGHRFNPHKVLLDPYAKAIGRPLRWGDEMFAYKLGDPAGDLSFDDRDNAALAPLGQVIDPAFTWGDDRLPNTPWQKTVIYEMHVKGFTQLHPEVPDNMRGSYAALASEPAIQHLKSLGVTAVELLPVHYHIDGRHLEDRKLVNYWGYNTLGFFAVEPKYDAPGFPLEAVREFKTMVRSLHAAGIEVILDVVYNHTAEGNQMGPTLSFRGIDNASYYRLSPEDKRYYMDFTGCGNTFHMQNPRVLQLIMDSLRYWITDMHVDGFRFDLASTLARELHAVDKLGAFFDIIHQDPIISQAKLIAEPWDLGEGGYQVGNFPALWSEWNGKYRDCVRRFWKGDGGVVSEFATRFCGSSDLYEWSSRRPHASVNFVTCHDGFSLQDLVSYDQKHNEANGEENRDGTNDNISWNCGVEGPTDDPEIIELRDRKKRNFIATLLFSQGVPMLLSGDEMGHTQRGNNNAYCQDNEITWLDWNLDERQQQLLEFTKRVIRIFHSQAVFHRRRFFHGQAIEGAEAPDITWLNVNGEEMSGDSWRDEFVRCLGVELFGNCIDVDDHGEQISGDTLLLLFNADHGNEIDFSLPELVDAHYWELLLDTAECPQVDCPAKKVESPYKLRPCSIALLRESAPEGKQVAAAERTAKKQAPQGAKN